MKKLLFALIFSTFIHSGHSQVKIDSLGFHLGKDGTHVIDVPEKSAEEIRSLIVEYAEENNWEMSNTEGSDYLKIKMSDNFMVYNRRSGVDGYVGQNTSFLMDFKDGKCRVRNMEPSFFFVSGGIEHRPEFIKESKKKPFLIAGNGNTLYDRDLVLRRSQRKIKPQMEAYCNNMIKSIGESLNSSKKDDW